MDASFFLYPHFIHQADRPALLTDHTPYPSSISPFLSRLPYPNGPILRPRREALSPRPETDHMHRPVMPLAHIDLLSGSSIEDVHPHVGAPQHHGASLGAASGGQQVLIPGRRALMGHYGAQEHPGRVAFSAVRRVVLAVCSAAGIIRCAFTSSHYTGSKRQAIPTSVLRC